MSSLNDIPSSTSTLVSFGTDWKIGQFSSLGREAVRSPYFGADVGHLAQFRMVLYPRGDGNHPDYVALFLEMQPNENIEMVEAYIKFTIDSVGPEFIGGKLFSCLRNELFSIELIPFPSQQVTALLQRPWNQHMGL